MNRSPFAGVASTLVPPALSCHSAPWQTTPTIMRHLDLPDDLVREAEAQVAAGRAASIEDVLRAGVAALEREQREHDARMAGLRAAIDEGDAAPDAAPGVFDRIRARHGLPGSR
jgi:Arc/MetJ-type ribon-helix-helix transcriptional regulator